MNDHAANYNRHAGLSAKAAIGMAGEWQAQVSFEGPAGKGQTSFSVTAQ